jgi:hypothetical protein
MVFYLTLGKGFFCLYISISPIFCYLLSIHTPATAFTIFTRVIFALLTNFLIKKTEAQKLCEEFMEDILEATFRSGLELGILFINLG